MTDAVDKVGDEQSAGNNRIQVQRFLNQCCAPDSYLESMLLARPSKNIFRQHRPIADLKPGPHVSNSMVAVIDTGMSRTPHNDEQPRLFSVHFWANDDALSWQRVCKPR